MDIDLRTFDPQRLELFFKVLVKALVTSPNVEGVTYRGHVYEHDRDLGGEIYQDGIQEAPQDVRYQVRQYRDRIYGLNMIEVPAPINAVNHTELRYNFTVNLELDEPAEDLAYNLAPNHDVAPQYTPIVESIINFIEAIPDPDNARLLLDRPLRLYNASNPIYNEDIRGADLLPIRLPQERDLSLGTVVSLHNLMDAIIRVKSHHFDWWYELYDKVKLSVTPQVYYLEIDFGFGS